MAGLLSPAMTVGGTDLYQQAGNIDARYPVYKPMMNRSGLLDDKKADNLVRHFAGGLLNGYQYVPSNAQSGIAPGVGQPSIGGPSIDIGMGPNGPTMGANQQMPGMQPRNQFSPIAPSGVYTADPNQGTTTDTPTPGSGLSYRDIIEMKYGQGGTGASGDRDFFISQLLGTNGTGGGTDPQWGASVDDAYDPNSEYWQNVQAMLAQMGNSWNGRGDGTGGGSPGGTNDAGQGGSDV